MLITELQGHIKDCPFYNGRDEGQQLVKCKGCGVMEMASQMKEHVAICPYSCETRGPLVPVPKSSSRPVPPKA